MTRNIITVLGIIGVLGLGFIVLMPSRGLSLTCGDLLNNPKDLNRAAIAFDALVNPTRPNLAEAPLFIQAQCADPRMVNWTMHQLAGLLRLGI